MGEVEAKSAVGDAAGQPSWSRSLPGGGYVYPRRKPKGQFRPGGTRQTKDPPRPGVQKACMGQSGRV